MQPLTDIPFTATWVRRPFEDDDEFQPAEGKMYLTEFQVEKFTYYFTDVFDHNKDRIITIEDIHALNEVRLYVVFLKFYLFICMNINSFISL